MRGSRKIFQEGDPRDNYVCQGKGGGIRGLFSVNLLREINKFEFMTPLPRPRPPLDPRIELTEEHERTYILPYIHVIQVS